MKQIYVVRHARAEGQAANAPLTAEGQEQAQELAAFFGDRPIDVIVSSPYTRASNTITPLAMQQGIAVQLDDRLTERVLSGEDCADWMDMLRVPMMIWICVMKAGNPAARRCSGSFKLYKRYWSVKAIMLFSCHMAT